MKAIKKHDHTARRLARILAVGAAQGAARTAGSAAIAGIILWFQHR